jgi:hypothetical protein
VVVCIFVVVDGLGRPVQVRRVRVEGQFEAGTVVLDDLGVVCGGLLLVTG